VKSIVILWIQTCVRISVSLLNKSQLGRIIVSDVLRCAFETVVKVNHNGCELKFSVPNKLNHIRANTFSTKEPETLEWIDSIPTGSVVWDIGANVGLYTCYAAKQRDCKVLAFEPSVFNLELLARNIFINNLVDRVTIIPLPLSDDLQTSTLNMSTTNWGGALSTFGEDYGHDGKLLDKVFEFTTIGTSMDKIQKTMDLPMPNYIKMDVDGIEHLILQGGLVILAKIDGILLEVNNDFKELSMGVNRELINAGLRLSESKHAEFFDDSEQFRNTYNQIWIKEKL